MKSLKKITQIIFISTFIVLTTQTQLRELTKKLSETCLMVSDFSTKYSNQLKNRTLKSLFTSKKKKMKLQTKKKTS